MHILVASCDHRSPLWTVWKFCMEHHWPDSPYPWSIVSSTISNPEYHTIPTGPDVNWMASIRTALRQINDPYVLLMLDDQFVSPPVRIEPFREYWTANIERALDIMKRHPEVNSIAASLAHHPELPWSGWDRLGIINREHHPFKRTTLSAARIWRKDFLIRLLEKTEARTPKEELPGRLGALAFETVGSLLTESEQEFPGLFLAVRRPARGLIDLMEGISTREGTFQRDPGELTILDAEGLHLQDIPGIEPFL